MKRLKKVKKIVGLVYKESPWKRLDCTPDAPLGTAKEVYQAYTKQVRDSYEQKSAAPDIPIDLKPTLLSGPNFGFRRNEVTLVAARPGAGKTAFIINAIDNLITAGGVNIAVFLPDMTQAEFCARLTAVRAGVEYDQFKKGWSPKSEWESIAKAGEEISSANLWISTGNTFTVQSVFNAARELDLKLKKEKKKLDIVFIDSLNYLAECGDPIGPKGWACDTLTDLAKAIDGAVVCAYDLGIDKEDASFKIHPKLRDFRIRGISEDYVGLIITIVRPEHYRIETLYKNEVHLDIVWDRFAPDRQGFAAKFNRHSLRFYTDESRDTGDHGWGSL